MNDSDLHSIKVGLDARAFRSSTIGEYLEDKANETIIDSLELLSEADPEDPKQIRKLQNDVWRAKVFLSWLSLAIQEGKEAEERLQEDITD